jgi:xanthine/uracil permease
MIAQWLQFIWLLATGVVTGTHACVTFGLVPTTRQLPAPTVWAFHRIFDFKIDRYMPLATAISIATGLGVLLTRAGATATERILIGVAVAGMALAALTSLTYNLRINRQLAGWTEEQVSAEEGEFRRLRANWTLGNRVRSTGAAVAFLLAVTISVFGVR